MDAQVDATRLKTEKHASPGLVMLMFEVPFERSLERNEFRRQAEERLSVVEPKRRSR